MSPWLKPGDVVLVQMCSAKELRVGDVVVMTKGDEAFVHRIIARTSEKTSWPFVTKGDRNDQPDHLKDPWCFSGIAQKRYRHGCWRKVRHGSILRWLSVLRLYPGQRLPNWLFFGRHLVWWC